MSRTLLAARPSGASFDFAAYPNPKALFRANGAASYTDAGGGRMSEILDQFGFGNKATQGTGANRPLYSAGTGPGGIDMFDFSLLSGAGVGAATGNIGLTAQTTVYTLGEWLGAGRYYHDGLSLNSRVIFSSSGTPTMFAGNPAPAWGSTITPGTMVVIACAFDGASSKIARDAGTPVSGNAGGSSSNGHWIGGGFGAPNTQCANCKIHMQVVYGSTHSTPNMTAIASAMKAIGGIP